MFGKKDEGLFKHGRLASNFTDDELRIVHRQFLNQLAEEAGAGGQHAVDALERMSTFDAEQVRKIVSVLEFGAATRGVLTFVPKPR